ncbi:adenine-specific DNA methylase [Calothrix sp. NIES-4071]|nr:adenine-specific DNA methylase [Calothrix sp. NIES-4071]BAZ60109.1 adenine-specific DNA methylase [Calothrix sp. NIES-4105]
MTYIVRKNYDVKVGKLPLQKGVAKRRVFEAPSNYNFFTSANQAPAKPFLKWAGGKGQLLEQISSYLPQSLLDGSINRYVEPFVGGGAMFFYLASSCYQSSINEFFIYDVNPELILAYKTIKHDVYALIEALLKIQSKYWSLSDIERSQYFYYIRNSFNLRRKSINFNVFNSNWVERAAQIIFLNRTCFNGLFRVNSKGEFNVPCGKYKKPLICNVDNLKAISLLLQNTHIELGDFTKCKEIVDDKTFVYFDPPYRPLSNTANFTGYSQNVWHDSEQLRLRDFFSELHLKGAKLLLSNSDPKNENINDNFFEDAYNAYRIERVKAARKINCNASKRGQITELVIMNY